MQITAQLFEGGLLSTGEYKEGMSVGEGSDV
jgi:hypothetical protein